MKNLIKLLILLISIFIYDILPAQSPHAINYQTVIRDDVGNLITNQEMTFQFTILEDSIEGNIAYIETHDVISDEFGQVNIEIGYGVAVYGTFTSISWGGSNKFLKIELDPDGGTTYIDMGTIQFLSTPYAFYADEAGNVNNSDTSTINELQLLSLDGYELTLSHGGGTVTLPMETHDPPDPNLPVPIEYLGEIIYVLPYDISDSVVWNSNTTIAVGATDLYDGEANTNLIVNTLGPGRYAAYMCDTLTAFGRDDWYLPSVYELQAMVRQDYLMYIDHINGANVDWPKSYWSSSEFSDLYAYIYRLISVTPNILQNDKTHKARCRCFRKDN